MLLLLTAPRQLDSVKMRAASSRIYICKLLNPRGVKFHIRDGLKCLISTFYLACLLFCLLLLHSIVLDHE